MSLNYSIGTDPQQPAAASPHVLVIWSFFWVDVECRAKINF